MNTLERHFRNIAKRVVYMGRQRYCNVCDRHWRKFRPFGLVVRPDAQCPGCRSLERHRLVWEFFHKRTDLLDGRSKQVLHVAPEPGFVNELRQTIGKGYTTADLYNPAADVQWDITDMPCPDESFDVVYCSHVLEHVPDDRKAMAEFYRVLKKGGWAVLNVPITAEQTVEDPSIEDPKERERLFGQHDHVRRYGPDYAERLREAGFQVEVVTPSDLFSQREITRQGLSNDLTGDIYYCTK